MTRNRTRHQLNKTTAVLNHRMHNPRKSTCNPIQTTTNDDKSVCWYDMYYLKGWSDVTCSHQINFVGHTLSGYQWVQQERHITGYGDKQTTYTHTHLCINVSLKVKQAMYFLFLKDNRPIASLQNCCLSFIVCQVSNRNILG